jgi:hypothetical protein
MGLSIGDPLNTIINNNIPNLTICLFLPHNSERRDNGASIWSGAYIRVTRADVSSRRSGPACCGILSQLQARKIGRNFNLCFGHMIAVIPATYNRHTGRMDNIPLRQATRQNSSRRMLLGPVTFGDKSGSLLLASRSSPLRTGGGIIFFL